jgi:hypothetical protein
VNERKEAMFTEMDRRRMPFILDSGASDHMVTDDRLMTDYENLGRPLQISVAKAGEHIEALGQGTLKLKSVIGMNKIKDLKLYKVLFVPSLKVNLLSVKRFEMDVYKITFEDGCVTIQEKSGEILAKGMRLQNLYNLDIFIEVPKSIALIGEVNENLVTWHKRLGHLGNSNLVKLIKHGMASGIDIKSDDLVGENRLCGNHLNRRCFVLLDLWK